MFESATSTVAGNPKPLTLFGSMFTSWQTETLSRVKAEFCGSDPSSTWLTEIQNSMQISNPTLCSSLPELLTRQGGPEILGHKPPLALPNKKCTASDLPLTPRCN